MADRTVLKPRHGAATFAGLSLDAYNSELRDREGNFVGDRASKQAFVAILEACRQRLRQAGRDALEPRPTEQVVETMDALLAHGDPNAAGIVLTALEAFAASLAEVIASFLALDSWRGTQRIVLGGGMRASRVGELAVARAGLLLNQPVLDRPGGPWVELTPICHDPDHAGLIGAAHLLPEALAGRYDSIVAADIGGTNLRAGVVLLGAAPDCRDAAVASTALWAHADEEPTRDQVVDRLVATLREQVEHAEAHGRRLAPFIGIGCPGVVAPDGAITRGGQNLPGDWEAADFNLPDRVRAALPAIGGEPTQVVLHNDAVLQGLSVAPFQTGVDRWGVLTIGTGLGNARFSRR